MLRAPGSGFRVYRLGTRGFGFWAEVVGLRNPGFTVGLPRWRMERCVFLLAAWALRSEARARDGFMKSSGAFWLSTELPHEDSAHETAEHPRRRRQQLQGDGSFGPTSVPGFLSALQVGRLLNHPKKSRPLR